MPLLLLAIATLGLGRGLIAAGIVVAVLLVPLIWRVLRFRGPADIGLQRDGDALAAQTETVVLADAVNVADPDELADDDTVEPVEDDDVDSVGDDDSDDE